MLIIYDTSSELHETVRELSSNPTLSHLATDQEFSTEGIQLRLH